MMTTIERAAVVAQWWADQLPPALDCKRHALREHLGQWVYDALMALPSDLMVQVDYEPDQMLACALEAAGIAWEDGVLPRKTHTMCWRDGTVEAARGYGTAITELTLVPITGGRR